MKKKVAFVARTSGLEYDDRIRKECISLSAKADVFIYVNFISNKAEEGVTSYGVPYKAIRLKTRDKLPSSRFLFFKSIEFYIKIRKDLRKYDLVWAHEIYAFIFPLFGKRRKYIWDLHELPARFERSRLKGIYKSIEKKCKLLIHANNHRKSHLEKKGMIKHPEKNIVIRNLPDEKFLSSGSNESEAFQSFKKWLKNSEYVYLQGISKDDRFPVNTIESILSLKTMKIVVVGGFKDQHKQQLINQFGEKIMERIYFTGMLDQLDIPVFMKNAKFTVVLYKMNTPNNIYCEPNRLFQAIAMGIPVVVGENPPMKEFVKKHDFGIVVPSDGKDVYLLKDAIKKLNSNYEHYKKNVEEFKNVVSWSKQQKVIENILN